ncbi:cobalt ECF transporter T component CbiQ [Caldichromatium japonicum]|uniref:Cobalt ECF transporter T component CbiQ n=1 Tax=Caldichromatium japonicum TaxID=2699430 RepID=A0A6G7VCK5_9GAMM|nr:energy-coupling factor transporter transmembrane component T [Caldichromatium japonicum]QIK37640.1 cobalt ECF transporter T component CbiQ [Caldichromatium japonicum]
MASGWLARRDPRLRLIAALVFALATMGLRSLWGAALALVLALGLALGAGVHMQELMRRLLVAEGLVAVLILTLPFSTYGPCALTFDGLCLSQMGLRVALLLFLKIHAALIALAALVGTLEPAALAQALGGLAVPQRLGLLLFLSIRQIHLTQTELMRLKQAMRARAFVPRADLHTWRTYGWLIGMLLLRSHRRAQRLLAAMRCRGFRERFHRLATLRWTGQDTLAACALAPLPLALCWLDRHLP